MSGGEKGGTGLFDSIVQNWYAAVSGMATFFEEVFKGVLAKLGTFNPTNIKFGLNPNANGLDEPLFKVDFSEAFGGDSMKYIIASAKRAGKRRQRQLETDVPDWMARIVGPGGDDWKAPDFGRLKGLLTRGLALPEMPEDVKAQFKAILDRWNKFVEAARPKKPGEAPDVPPMGPNAGSQGVFGGGGAGSGGAGGIVDLTSAMAGIQQAALASDTQERMLRQLQRQTAMMERGGGKGPIPAPMPAPVA